MEPDIIRMYSSSPPPLDNGTEDDDEDEFGEFGEFNEVESSSVGFADFDAPSYPNSKDVFIPPNLFMPIQDYSDINNFSCSKMDQDCCAELSGSVLGQSDLLETITCNQIKPSRTSNSPCDDGPSPSCIIKSTQQKEYFVKQERISPEILRSEGINSNLDLQISNYNGNKVPSLEILTNGFAVLDSVNPQGIENLDVGSPSKELHSFSTKLSLNSLRSSCEIDALSNKSTALLEETDHQAHTPSSDEGVLKSQENNGLIKLVPQRTVADLKSNENKYLSELNTVEICLSKDIASCQQKEDAPELSPLSLECSSTLPINSSIQHSLGSDKGSNEVANEGKVNGHVHSRTDYSTETVNGSSEITNEVDLLSQTKSISIVHTEMVTLDGFENVTNTELGKDFITLPVTSEGSIETVIHTVLPTFGDTETPTRSMPLKGTLEQFQQVSTLGGDYDESRRFSGDLHCEFSAFDTVPKQTLNMFSDVKDTKNKYSDFPLANKGEEEDGEFESRDFDSVPKTQEKMDSFQDFDDFADFSSASCNPTAEWNAFEAEQKGSAWATFDEKTPVDSMDKQEPWQPHRTEMPMASDCDQASHETVLSISDKLESAVHGSESAAVFQTSLIGRLERIFLVCFPSCVVPTEEETVATLKVLLEHGEKLTEKESGSEDSLDSGKQIEVWMKLQNIHDGYGLRYQWGGSHSNKMLLRSLGIDTRNILFTGNRKQPVIVPMYASGLGMLEPTKEPLKPVSAAEKITSIGHTPPVSPEIAPSDQLQESLPPVQFDWSSSGLTNPLDASGGASLLNLDFFGPVDDSSCSSTTTIPGVDPELYELTTSKLESSNTSSKVTDAFAKLMSTVEKTSTSTRKPKKEEHLSEEAAKVIASLPDLSFMHAKVLMFPTTLTPSTGSQEKVD